MRDITAPLSFFGGFKNNSINFIIIYFVITYKR